MKTYMHFVCKKTTFFYLSPNNSKISIPNEVIKSFLRSSFPPNGFTVMQTRDTFTQSLLSGHYYCEWFLKYECFYFSSECYLTTGKECEKALVPAKVSVKIHYLVNGRQFFSWNSLENLSNVKQVFKIHNRKMVVFLYFKVGY